MHPSSNRTALVQSLNKIVTPHMMTQHEFCFLACGRYGQRFEYRSEVDRFRTAAAYLCIKHLALCAQPVALSDQDVDLFSPLQHALDGLMQHNLGLVELLLDFHDAVRLGRVLVLDNVFLQLGKGARIVWQVRAREGRAGVLV